MNFPVALLTIYWMIRDTFRQSLASRLFWVMLGLSALCIAFCFSIRVSGGERLPQSPADPAWRLPREEAERKARELKERELRYKDASIEEILRQEGIDVASGEIAFAFGAASAPLGKDRLDAVRYVQILLANVVADTTGILLAILWTAGFLPTFLEPSAITVLLAKPVPRWSLLVGKYLGVMVFLALQAGFFVLGTWFALGVATGIWDARYLFAFPVLLIHFGTFFSVSALLAVATRSTVVCALGTMVFWFICWGINYGRHALLVFDLSQTSRVANQIIDIAYWILPKPMDFNIILVQALDALTVSSVLDISQKLIDRGLFQPHYAVLSGGAFIAVVLASASYEFSKMDY